MDDNYTTIDVWSHWLWMWHRCWCQVGAMSSSNMGWLELKGGFASQKFQLLRKHLRHNTQILKCKLATTAENHIKLHSCQPRTVILGYSGNRPNKTGQVKTKGKSQVNCFTTFNCPVYQKDVFITVAITYIKRNIYLSCCAVLEQRMFF